MNKSPYLRHQGRLADVIAAIQVLGSHLWDSREIKDWKKNIGDEPLSANSWESVFSDHPEFFGSDSRVNKTFYFLRLRRAYEQTVDTKTSKELSENEITQYKSSKSYNPDDLARRVLTPNQIEMLIKAAVELQVSAPALEDRKRWWIPLACAALSFSGALLGSWLKPVQQSSAPSAQSSALNHKNPARSNDFRKLPSELRPTNTLAGAPMSIGISVWPSIRTSSVMR